MEIIDTIQDERLTPHEEMEEKDVKRIRNSSEKNCRSVAYDYGALLPRKHDTPKKSVKPSRFQNQEFASSMLRQL